MSFATWAVAAASSSVAAMYVGEKCTKERRRIRGSARPVIKSNDCTDISSNKKVIRKTINRQQVRSPSPNNSNQNDDPDQLFGPVVGEIPPTGDSVDEKIDETAFMSTPVPNDYPSLQDVFAKHSGGIPLQVPSREEQQRVSPSSFESPRIQRSDTFERNLQKHLKPS